VQLRCPQCSHARRIGLPPPGEEPGQQFNDLRLGQKVLIEQRGSPCRMLLREIGTGASQRDLKSTPFGVDAQNRAHPFGQPALLEQEVEYGFSDGSEERVEHAKTLPINRCDERMRRMRMHRIYHKKVMLRECSRPSWERRHRACVTKIEK
jgi:hypothetical protein